MKHCIALALLLCMLLSCSLPAAAERPQVCMLLDSGIDYITYPEYPIQGCFVPVTIIIDTVDGTPVSSSTSISVATITYKYEVYVEPNAETNTNVYSGGRIGGDPYPKVEALHPSLLPVAPVVTKISNPPRKDFSFSDYSYTIIYAGGLIEITYPHVLHYDANMNLIDYETTTVQRTFYLQETGPKENHNIG